MAQRRLAFRVGDGGHAVTVDYTGEGLRMRVDDGASATVDAGRGADGTLTLAIDGVRQSARVVAQDDRRHVFLADGAYVLTYVDPLAGAGEGHGIEGGFAAPMPGKVIAWLAQPGSDVAKGAPLLILEAMKMEHTITAPAAGKLVRYRFTVGEQVSEGAELVEFVVAEA